MNNQGHSGSRECAGFSTRLSEWSAQDTNVWKSRIEDMLKKLKGKDSKPGALDNTFAAFYAVPGSRLEKLLLLSAL